MILAGISVISEVVLSGYCLPGLQIWKAVLHSTPASLYVPSNAGLVPSWYEQPLFRLSVR